VRLLVTRPEPDGERTAAALRARGHEVLLAPLLRTEFVPFDLPDEAFAAVVLTSTNAARAVAQHPQRGKLTALPAFTVGRRTAEAAREVGFREVRSADGDQRDLVELLRDARTPLLYLAGEDRAGDLTAAVSVVAYRAVKIGEFPPEVAAALTQGALDGVLHFSRRTAEAYLDCAEHAGCVAAALVPLQLCLSKRVAEPLAAAGGARIRLAERPDEASLLALAEAGTGG
jgi:uroporphyrinogen-III synthase